MLVRVVVQTLVSFAVQAAILFVAADDWAWQQGWAWLGEIGALSVAITAWLYVNDPELMKARLSSPFKRNQRPLDLILVVLISLAYVAWIALMGVDAHRFFWTSVPLAAQIAGAVLVGFGMVLVWEVFRTNTFATTQVRVQTERQQKVIDTGPYRYVRHPMYLGMLLYMLGSPLVLGSLWGLAGSAAIIIGFALRTLGEEKVLKADLPGYEAYMQTTKWRIIPGIW
jgi:protein-S-isoprenylcysteine O-methyltransferase Ste14